MEGGMRFGSGFGGMMTQSPTGTNLRSSERKKAREETLKKMENSKSGPTLFDPYYNIVEVKIYGQARFYNPPPEETEGETTSPGEEATTKDEPTAKVEAAAKPAEDKKAADTKKAAPAAPK